VLEGTGKEMLVAKEMMWSHAQVNLTMMLKMLQVLKGSYLQLLGKNEEISR
jgi:hypothetical protein